MKLYDFFTSIANYFWKKALQPRKENIIHATQGNRIRKITEFWLECMRCKAKTKKGYC